MDVRVKADISVCVWIMMLVMVVVISIAITERLLYTTTNNHTLLPFTLKVTLRWVLRYCFVDDWD